MVGTISLCLTWYPKFFTIELSKPVAFGDGEIRLSCQWFKDRSCSCEGAPNLHLDPQVRLWQQGELVAV